MPHRFVRHRLGKVFLRVYLGIFAALLVAVLLSLLLVKVVNQVRLEAYQEQQLSGLMLLFAEELYVLGKQDKEDWLTEMNHRIGPQVAFISLSGANLSPREMRRLAEARPLLREHDEQGWTVLWATPLPDQLLQLHFRYMAQEKSRASLVLLQRALFSLPKEERSVFLQHHQAGFAYPLALLDTPPTTLNQRQNTLLDQGDSILLLAPDGRSFTGYMQVDAQQWLELGPVALFDTYPASLIISMAALIVTLLALSLWWLLAGLEARLHPLEKASRLIAAGNLDARVEVETPDFIGQLGRVFNRMAEQVQRLLRTQQEMIHAVSHELRTPVARIRFGLQMIEDLAEDHTEDSAFYQRVMKQIRGVDKDIDELDQLIDEILTYARLGQDKLKLDFQTHDVRALVDEVMQAFQRTHSKMQLHLVCLNEHQCSTEADVEARYFQRALQNLIGNGLRYAQQQLTVVIQIEADTLRIDVEDDGPGIPEQDWARVFMPFSRLDDSRTRSSGGYGLGLSIVQRIIYWHRGSALVDRSPQLGGARFSLIFPKFQAKDDPPIEYPPQ